MQSKDLNKGSFKILIRNIRIKKDEKYKIPDIEDPFIQGEESKDYKPE